MAHRHKVHEKHKHEFNVGGAALSYGNKDVVAAARKGGSNPGIKAIQKKDGGKVVGKKAGGRLDKRARGGGLSKSPFSGAGK